MTPNILVTNTGSEPFSKAWNSMNFEFPVGEEVMIPEPAAKYLFGFSMGEKEREACLLRNGWLSRSEPVTKDAHNKAMARLDAFVFKNIAMGKQASKAVTLPKNRPTMTLPPKADNV